MQPEVHIISCGPLIPSAIVVNFKTDSNHRYSFILAAIKNWFLIGLKLIWTGWNRYNLVLEIVITNTCILPLLIISFCFMKIYIGCPPPSLALKNPCQSESNRFIFKSEKSGICLIGKPNLGRAFFGSPKTEDLTNRSFKNNYFYNIYYIGGILVTECWVVFAIWIHFHRKIVFIF